MELTPGKVLRQFRGLRGLTQQDLGRLVDAHFTTISKYERDESTPSRDIANHMDEALMANGVVTRAFGYESGGAGKPEFYTSEEVDRLIALAVRSAVRGTLLARQDIDDERQDGDSDGGPVAPPR